MKKFLVCSLVFILSAVSLVITASAAESVSTHAELAAILARDNSAGTTVSLANDILLEDGQTYDFTGVTFDVTDGIMLVPEDSLVTIIGFRHVTPEGDVRTEWGRYALGLYIQGVASSSWIFRPDLTLEETGTPDQVRWWDIYHGSPHWCPFNAHGFLSPPIPVATYEVFVAATEARRRGGLTDIMGNSVDNSITLRFTNDITLVSGRTYNLTDVEFITTDGELIIPDGVIIVDGVADYATDVELELVIGRTNYTLNGARRQSDAAPFIDTESNRTMVPIRLVAEGLGAEVDWDAGTQTALITMNGVTSRLVIGTELPGDMGTPVIVDNRTFVPVRYVSETLGAEVDWDGATQTVTIRIL